MFSDTVKRINWWHTYHSLSTGLEAESQYGRYAPEHGAPICISGGDLSVVACIDGAERGVQRVAGASPRQLDICMSKGSKVRTRQPRRQGTCTNVLLEAHLSP